jgi:hypothetical protein
VKSGTKMHHTHTRTGSVLNIDSKRQIKSMAKVRILGAMCANFEVLPKKKINK